MIIILILHECETLKEIVTEGKSNSELATKESLLNPIFIKQSVSKASVEIDSDNTGMP